MGEVRPELYSRSPFPSPCGREQLNEYDCKLDRIRRDGCGRRRFGPCPCHAEWRCICFGQLVGRYDRKLLRIAHHVTHNREDSQDAVQESFIKALQHLGEFREHSQFSTWLFRITVNQALMELRKRRTTVDVSLDEAFRADDDLLPSEVGCPPAAAAVE